MPVDDDDREVAAFMNNLAELIERVEQGSMRISNAQGPLFGLLEELRGVRKEIAEVRDLLTRVLAKGP